MSALVANGHIVDIAIAWTLIEVLALALYYRRTGRGVPPRDYLANAASGLSLMLALRCALTDAPWGWIALGLAGAGAAHLTDLVQRWRR